MTTPSWTMASPSTGTGRPLTTARRGTTWAGVGRASQVTAASATTGTRATRAPRRHRSATMELGPAPIHYTGVTRTPPAPSRARGRDPPARSSPDLVDGRFPARASERGEAPVLRDGAAEPVVGVAAGRHVAPAHPGAPPRGEDAVPLAPVVLVVAEEKGRKPPPLVGRAEPARPREDVQERREVPVGPRRVAVVEVIGVVPPHVDEAGLRQPPPQVLFQAGETVPGRLHGGVEVSEGVVAEGDPPGQVVDIGGDREGGGFAGDRR